MPYKDLIKCWHEGVLAADQKDFESALRSFSGFEDPPSKIWFNIGCIQLMRGELHQALEAYDKSISKDSRLAVGFHQRSYVHFKLARYEKALSDCHLAVSHLRSNSVIDYKQLGLRHLLYIWEVLYNTAAVLCHLDRWQSAEEKLKEALAWLPGDSRNDPIRSALEQVQKHLLIQPVSVPEGELFRPRKQEVEQLESKDFLGKPKVISSVVPNDEFSGFEPLRPQKAGFYEPCPEAILGRGPGYHRLLAHYYPENSNEVAVKASSVVFVLDKEGDWATAIYDGQKILIPTNLMEPTNPPKADIKKKNNGIPHPPIKMPPARPSAKPGVELLVPLQQGTLTLNNLPPRPTEDPPVPYKLKTFVPSAQSLLEIAGPLQSSSHSSQDARQLETVPPGAEPVVEVDVPLKSEAQPDVEAQVTSDTAQEVAAPASVESETLLRVHTEIIVTMKVRNDMTCSELQNQLRTELRHQVEQMSMELSYKAQNGKELTVVRDDADLQGVLSRAGDDRVVLSCKDSSHCAGRPILYRMFALYDYPAEGPEDLTFTTGKVIDILSEVNAEWLEGHCAGNIGIFPRCFVSRFASAQNEATT